MTVSEYNKEFYPNITQAKIAVEKFDQTVNAVAKELSLSAEQTAHMKSIFASQFGLTDEVKKTILEALESYRKSVHDFLTKDEKSA